ncbi:MAG: hypothetical protein EZS28_037271, partial [Streblomastix strix]
FTPFSAPQRGYAKQLLYLLVLHF